MRPALSSPDEKDRGLQGHEEDRQRGGNRERWDTIIV